MFSGAELTSVDIFPPTIFWGADRQFARDVFNHTKKSPIELNQRLT
jgi:hypothetical protein